MAKKSNSRKEREFLDAVMKKRQRASDADDHNRTAAIEDLNFANNEQWTNDEKKRRSDRGRPCLTLNKLTKYIRQVVGDILHNTPSIKFVPVDSHGDVNLATIRQGLVSSIQYNSDAESIYDYSANMLVTCGYGAWRVITKFTDDNPFNQEILLELIKNPFLVYLDPACKNKFGLDARWGFVLSRLNKEDFEARFPDSTFEVSGGGMSGKGISAEAWYDRETVTVAEYFEIKDREETKILLDDGRVLSESEFKDLTEKWERRHGAVIDALESQIAGGPPPPKVEDGGSLGRAASPTTPQQAPSPLPAPAPQMPPSPQPALPSAPVPPPQQGGMPAPGGAPVPAMKPGPPPPPRPMEVSRRTVKVPEVRHWILTADEIIEGGLEGDVVSGRHIPIVLVKGPEISIEGKSYVYSLIRHAKDPQKLINYWNSAAAEVVSNSPKAPFMVTPKQVEGHETSYAMSNVDNQPFLYYNNDSEVPGPPSRLAPMQVPAAMLEQIRLGEENLKDVIGMFNADIGAKGSEQTGAAILARQRPGDISTYIFAKILNGAVAATGKIINEQIPEVYDTERDVQIRRTDERESFVPVNTTVGEALKRIKRNPERYAGLDASKLVDAIHASGPDTPFNDITSGKFGVRATSGPSYATQRQESAQLLLQLAQAMPDQMKLAADLIIENLDFKDADELSGRLRKPLVLQGVVPPRPGEKQLPPPPPSPQVMLAQVKMENEKLKLQQQNLKSQQELLRLEIEKIRLQAVMVESQSGNAHKVAESVDRSQREWERHNLERDKFDHQRVVDAGRLENDRYSVDAAKADKVNNEDFGG